MPKPAAKPRKKNRNTSLADEARKKLKGLLAPIRQRSPGSGNRNTDRLLKRLEKIERPKKP